MTLLITPNPALQIVPPDFDFTAEWQSESVITTPGSPGSPYVIDDASVVDESSTETRYEGPATTDPPDALDNMQFESVNPSVATVSSTGYVTSITDGSTTIRCRRKHVLRELAVTAVVDEVSTITQLDEYLTGTLGKHIQDAAAALLTESTQVDVYSSGTTRNPNVWTGDLDLTGVAYGNSMPGSPRRGATLISPRHVVMATHYAVSVGQTISFVTAGGTVVTRTLSAIQDVVAGSAPTSRDARIGRLDSDVPGTITWYEIMPADWQDYLTLYPNSNLPVIAFDQQRKALQRWRQHYPYPANDPGQQAVYNAILAYHTEADQASEAIVTGDSGQPLFHPVNGELVLLGCHTWDRSCYLASQIKTEIDAAMTSLGGGYTSTAADLSGFNNYG